MSQYDLVVIAGSGGVRAARMAAISVPKSQLSKTAI